jgi:hypothetical protein
VAKKPAEDPLVAKAFGAGSQEDLAKLIGNLNQAEADYFLKKLEAALRKRKIMLSGYIIAMVSWLVGMVCAVAYFGLASGFTGWVFLVPFMIVGLILWLFGALAERAGRAVPPDPNAAVPDPK